VLIIADRNILSRYFFIFFRNGKIHRYPLRVRKLIIFNKERYERIKGIVRGGYAGIARKRKIKKLSAKNKKASSLPKEHINTDYTPSNIIYACLGDNWRWRRVDEWFNELEAYYNGTDKKRLEKNIGTE